MKRLTKRISGSRCIYLPAYKGSACQGQYCQNAKSCELVPDRLCGYLQAIDRLADLEDVLELNNIDSIDILKDILKYCEVTGITNKIRVQFMKGDVDYDTVTVSDDCKNHQ